MAASWVASAIGRTGILGGSTRPPAHYFVNPAAHVATDVKCVVALALAMAVVTWAVQRQILWPLARLLVRDPRDPLGKTTAAPQGAPESAAAGAASGTAVRRRGVSSPKADAAAPTASESFQASDSVQRMHADVRRLIGKQHKFVVAATRMLSYLSLLATAWVGLRGQEAWLFDPFKQHITFRHTVPAGVRIFYYSESAYYLYTLFSMFWEPRMKDRAQMLTHHVFTLFLLGTSWYYNAIKYGVYIAALHDLSDPLMEAAKLCNYTGFTSGANVLFVLFALSFFYLRVYIFPTGVIYATYANTRSYYPHYWATFSSLVGLWVLHVIWSFMICKVFYRNVVVGDRTGDIREEDD